MDHDLLIREARETDLASLRGLIEELFEAMDSPPDGGLAAAEENCLALMRDPQSRVLIAHFDGEAAGFINFTFRRTICHAGPSGLIDELVVSAGHRGQGIGGRLIAAAADACREWGCEELEVSTESENTRAREFYKNCGFDEEAVLLEMQLEK